jgi:hypothetical protein
MKTPENATTHNFHNFSEIFHNVMLDFASTALGFTTHFMDSDVFGFGLGSGKPKPSPQAGAFLTFPPQ